MYKFVRRSSAVEYANYSVHVSAMLPNRKLKKTCFKSILLVGPTAILSVAWSDVRLVFMIYFIHVKCKSNGSRAPINIQNGTFMKLLVDLLQTF